MSENDKNKPDNDLEGENTSHQSLERRIDLITDLADVVLGSLEPFSELAVAAAEWCYSGESSSPV